MTLCFYKICVVQWFVFKIITAQMPASMSKYIQMGNMGPIRPVVPNMPSVPMSYPNPSLSSVLSSCQSLNLPNLQNLPNLANLQNFANLPNFSNLPNFPNQPSPNMPNLPNFSNLPLPSQMSSPPPPMNALAPFPMPSLPFKMPCQKTSSFDPTVLNNLAIALHLLILTNLLNPPDSTDPKLPNFPEPKPSQPPATSGSSQPYPSQSPQPPQSQPAYTQPNQQGYFPEDPNYPPQNQPFAPPNSKFLAGSGFGDTMPASMMGPFSPTQPPNPRNGHSLMSPYEALTPTSNSYSKDVFAQYGPQNLKADFQSPYQSIMANDNTSKDLFSLF